MMLLKTQADPIRQEREKSIEKKFIKLNSRHPRKKPPIAVTRLPKIIPGLVKRRSCFQYFFDVYVTNER